MTKEEVKVLSLFLKNAEKGQTRLNVFDIRYETCYEYEKLKKTLDTLCGNGEVEEIDLKTYEYVGDENVDAELIRAYYAQHGNGEKTASKKTKAKPTAPPYVTRLEELRKRREEFMRRFNGDNEENEDGDGDNDGEDEDADGNSDIFNRLFKPDTDESLMGGGEDEEDGEDGE